MFSFLTKVGKVLASKHNDAHRKDIEKNNEVEIVKVENTNLTPVVESVFSVTEFLVKFGVKREIASAWGPEYEKHLSKYALNSPQRLAAFFSNLFVESGKFTRLEENLNYSAKRLAQVWPSRFKAGGDNKNPTPNKLAIQAAHNPQKLADLVYMNRMGNTVEGDGWRHRGRGPIQITGKDNYTMCAKDTGLDCLRNPDILLTIEGGVISSLWYWDRAKLNQPADKGDIDAVRDYINIGRRTLKHGDAHGFNQMKELYDRMLPYLKEHYK